ncbi:hypothetical protein TNCV_1476731 [Trichonephila clavipes]|nr:hypothetical protein TNCV_1476731 [Trichonephila clavipes]
MKAIEPAAVASSLEDLRHWRVTASNLRKHLVKILKCCQNIKVSPCVGEIRHENPVLFKSHTIGYTDDTSALVKSNNVVHPFPWKFAA